MKLKEFISINKNNDNYLKNPYVIAEAGVNHEGSMEIAKKLIHDAKEGGADGIKFQTYKAELIASKNSPSYWDLSKESTKSQYDLFKKYDSFWKNEFEELKKYCDKSNIEFLSTPFDLESATFLNDLMDVYKISSSDITNKPFIKFISDFNKPILLSTGASTIDEIRLAKSWINEKLSPLVLLHCVLNYPTKNYNANLGMIKHLKKEFPNNIIGYSDHTLPQNMKICEIANLLGARVIEKHFTHDKSLKGNDHYHAMDKYDLKKFVKNINYNFEIIGKTKIELDSNQEISRQNARRSLVANKLIKKNKKIELSDLTFKRPASGISPSEIDLVIGRITKSDIEEDSIIKWNMFK